MNEKLKVLLVDDEPTNLDILEEMLEDRFTTCLAETGEQALDLVKTFQPKVVLLDVMMPGIDGFQTCREIRANTNLPDIKVIMVSAKAGRDDIDKGMEAGADEYITKPFDEDTLFEILDRFQ